MGEMQKSGRWNKASAKSKEGEQWNQGGDEESHYKRATFEKLFTCDFKEIFAVHQQQA